MLSPDETQTQFMVPEFIKKKKSSFVDLQNTNQFDREYVKPIKSISESLHTHDILYGGDQNQCEYTYFLSANDLIPFFIFIFFIIGHI